jgi:hypothetical protein
MNLGELIAGLRAAGAEFEDVEAKRAAGACRKASLPRWPHSRTRAGALLSSGWTSGRDSRPQRGATSSPGVFFNGPPQPLAEDRIVVVDQAPLRVDVMH